MGRQEPGQQVRWDEEVTKEVPKAFVFCRPGGGDSSRL